MVVYWSAIPAKAFSAMRYHKPFNCAKYLNTEIAKLSSSPTNNYRACPVVVDHLKSTFALKHPLSFAFRTDHKERVDITIDDPDFDLFQVRNPAMKLYSMSYHYIFFSEESIEMHYTPAYFSDNEFVNKTMLVPGRYDISKWFRPMDCAFLLKDGVDQLSMTDGEDYAYVTFETREPIKMKQFLMTPELEHMASQVIKSKNFKQSNYNPINWYYNLFERNSFKTKILKEIKDNILE